MTINDTLLGHLECSRGAAWVLRHGRPKLVESVRNLFETRTDISRLDAAEKTAALILGIHGLEELAALRAIVAKQELMRHIKYERQTDHTAHTVYLYLLGIWFYDNVPVIKTAIDEYLSGNTEAEFNLESELTNVRNFLFVWSYASLLHDLGYVFYDLSQETQEDRKAVDRIYTLRWLLEQLPDARPATTGVLRRTHGRFRAIYARKLPPPTSKYAQNAYREILRRLASVPWAGDLHASWAGKTGFQILDPVPGAKGQAKLERFAMSVARSGYSPDRSGRCVDHAVASGLMLFQYASYWYWLMNEVRQCGDDEVIEEVFEGFDYKMENLVRYTVLGCRACAQHNARRDVPGGSTILRNFDLKRDPVLFLSALCDELQRWDRFAAGAGHLNNWQEYKQFSLESSHIELKSQGVGRAAKAGFFVRSPLFRVDQLAADLKNRIVGWSRVVDLKE
jgi:hypothetical protein